MCMNCMLCYAACAVYGLERAFVGPAGIAAAYRYNRDSRDEGYRLREPVLSEAVGVWECTFVGECSLVCPKWVDPAAAIQRAKLAGAAACLPCLPLRRVGPRWTGRAATAPHTAA